MNEWLELQFDYSNTGSSLSANSSITVSSSSSYLTIDNNSVLIGDIASQSSSNVSFDAYVEGNVPLGEIAIITVELSNGIYSDTETFYLELNPPTESQSMGVPTLLWLQCPLLFLLLKVVLITLMNLAGWFHNDNYDLILNAERGRNYWSIQNNCWNQF